jgi:dihydrofolate synthase/folylpolyglutamate synthase
MSNLPTTLSSWLALLESRHAETVINMGLDRVLAVKERLRLAFACPVIMVAGTNGKGSTCAMLESVLLRAGYKVGLYIKPHFLDFNERARVNGELATDAALVEAFNAVEAARGDTTLTYFEFTTLAIMRLLAGAGMDVVILEVGLGGRLDAVNITPTTWATRAKPSVSKRPAFSAPARWRSAPTRCRRKP